MQMKTANRQSNLDDKDEMILNSLREDASKPLTKLSSKLGIPRATLQDRVKRLVKEGVIKRFTIVPDFSKLGKPVAAFIMVSFTPTPNVSQRELAKEISLLPEAEEVHLISGQWDIVVKVRVSRVEDIGELVIDRIRVMKGVEKTETCVSFGTIKED